MGYAIGTVPGGVIQATTRTTFPVYVIINFPNLYPTQVRSDALLKTALLLQALLCLLSIANVSSM